MLTAWWLALKLGAGKLWELLLRVPWKAWAVVGVLVVGWYYGHRQYAQGVADTEAIHQAKEAALEKRVAEARAKSAVVTERIVTQYVDKVRVIRERGATIVKEVPVYVPLDSCPLPGGYRVLHDSAAAGVLPDPARIPFAAPVPAQVAAATTADNYATCLENAEAQNGLLRFGCAHGWPVAANVCDSLGMPPKPVAK